MSAEKIVTACVIIIGNEILSGRTQDANLAHIAQGLNQVGVRLKEARVIPDIEEVIVRTINEVRAAFDYVFTTGGIGPTHDDITADSIARAFGVKNVIHPEALKLLQASYKPEDLNPARLRMAHTPEGAELIVNAVSRAPGFRIGNVFVMAGVPSVMRAMFDGLKHTLKGGAPVQSRSVACTLAEGLIAAGLEAIQYRYPELDIGSYPFYRQGHFGTSLVLRGTDAARLATATEAVATLIRSLGGEPMAEE
jgi:molybdenum cofactor synthesis domain-containing protein